MSKALAKKNILSLLKLIALSSFLFSSTLKTLAIESENKSTRFIAELNQEINNDSMYLLGPGDTLEIRVNGLPELSGLYSIGPDGKMYLPEINQVYAEGLTLTEFKSKVEEQLSNFLKDTSIFMRLVAYRPVRVFITGEVSRPGFYTLTETDFKTQSERLDSIRKFSDATKKSVISSPFVEPVKRTPTTIASKTLFPTLYDAIKASQGITNFSDLSSVEVIRKNSQKTGGGRIKAKINFLSIFTELDMTQNIRIYDGDFIKIPKGTKPLREQLLSARNLNLNPNYLNVYVSGNVEEPGEKILPYGSTLNHAIALSGGTKVLSGYVSFLRFGDGDQYERRKIKYSPGSNLDRNKNPLLMSGDIIHVDQSIAGKSTEYIKVLTSPAIGIYSFYNLFND